MTRQLWRTSGDEPAVTGVGVAAGPGDDAARDGGFVTIAVAGLLLVLVCLGGVAASLGAVAVARHRAASAADLAALAAARHRLEGAVAACAAAHDVAAAQGARVDGCALDGEVVTVTVLVHPPGPVGRLGVARSRARAGPAALPAG